MNTMSSLTWPRLAVSDLAVTNARFQSWWAETHADLVEMTLCDKPGEFSVTPLQIDEAHFRGLQETLPALLAIARRAAIAGGQAVDWARRDQKSLVAAYINAPRRPIVARPDGIFTEGRLRLIELNIDSGIGGYAEVDFVQRRFAALAGDAAIPRLETPVASDALVEVLSVLRREVDTAECHLALVAYPHFRPYHVAQVEALAERLTRQLDRCTAYVVTADGLTVGLDWMRDGQRDYHLLWRFGAMTHPEEQMRPVVAALLGARSTQTIVMSDPVDLGVEGKLVLALLSEAVDEGRHEALGLSGQEANLVSTHVPWTRFVTPGVVSFRGERGDLSALLDEHRAELVLKRGHSKSTQHVHLGAETSVEAWRELAAGALDAPGTWVVQENLRSPLLPFMFFDERGRLVTQPCNFTFNPYVFGTACGAPLIRIERDPRRRKVAMAVSSAMALTGTVLMNDEQRLP
jgi:hypothetical protein